MRARLERLLEYLLSFRLHLSVGLGEETLCARLYSLLDRCADLGAWTYLAKDFASSYVDFASLLRAVTSTLVEGDLRLVSILHMVARIHWRLHGDEVWISVSLSGGLFKPANLPPHHHLGLLV